MSYTINVNRLEGEAEADSSNRVSSFKLSLAQMDFGYLFLNAGRRTYTIAWRGQPAFNQLDRSARAFHRQLELLIHNTAEVWEPLRLRVALILESELVKLEISDKNDERRYLDLLERPYEIAFARYDFYRIGSNSIFSFTAENPLINHSTGELAAMLPSSFSITHGLLTWMVSQHLESDILLRHLDASASARLISEMVRSQASYETQPG